MNKSDLIDAIAAKSGLTKADSARALDAFTVAVGETLASGEKVTITGFGTFKGTARAARMGMNPASKTPMEIAAHTVISFKAGTGLKSSL